MCPGVTYHWLHVLFSHHSALTDLAYLYPFPDEKTEIYCVCLPGGGGVNHILTMIQLVTCRVCHLSPPGPLCPESVALVAAWLGWQWAVQRAWAGGRPLAANFLLFPIFYQTRTRTTVTLSSCPEECSLQPVSEQKARQASWPSLVFFPPLASFPHETILYSSFPFPLPMALTTYRLWQSESTLSSDWLPQFPTIPWSWHPDHVYSQITASFPSSRQSWGPSFHLVCPEQSLALNEISSLLLLGNPWSFQWT